MSKREPKALALPNLTRKARWDLNRLLTKLEYVAGQRQRMVDEGFARALEAHLDEPLDAHPDTTKLYMQVSDKEGLIAYYAAKLDSVPGCEKISTGFRSLDFMSQIYAIAVMDTHHETSCDSSERLRLTKTLDHIYREIRKTYPKILYNEDDGKGVERLAAFVKQAYPTIKYDWPRIPDLYQIQALKHILEQAYPQDDVMPMHMGFEKFENRMASYVHEADAIVMQPKLSWYMALFATTHEFHHRRQGCLAEAFAKHNLDRDSAEFYQARLFNANLHGGYLSAHFVGQLRYARQPVERHANHYARMACTLAEASQDKLLSHVFAISAHTVRMLYMAGRQTMGWTTAPTLTNTQSGPLP